MREIDIQNQIRLALSKYGVVIRQNTGNFLTADGRWVHCGVILKYRYKEIDKQEADREYQEKKRNYENAQTEQEIHQITCRMRVEMAKLNRQMQVNGCELCKRALTILDGRKL